MIITRKDIAGKVLGALFILMGFPKVFGMQMVVGNFERWLLTDTMRMFTGMLEILLGAMLFMESTKRYAAFGLFCMMPAGAMVHIIAGEVAMFFLPVVFGVLLLWYLVKQGVLNFSK